MTLLPLRHTIERVLPFVAIALVVILSACSSNDQATDYRIKHSINAVPETVSIILGVSTETASLNSADETRLHRFARDYINRGRSILMLSVSPSKIRVGERLRALFISWGVHKNFITVQSTLEQDDIVEMRFVGYKALIPECGDWSSGSNFNWNNKTHSNFGCATQRNLGLIVADPGDLFAYEHLARNLARGGGLDEELAALESEVVRDAGAQVPRLQRSLALAAAGRGSEAAMVLETVLLDEPSSNIAYNFLKDVFEAIMEVF